MRGAVVADQPGAVHREHDVQLLQADVVDDLVVGALQERRVDRRDRLAPLEREPGGEQHRLLLGDPDVEVAVGQLALEDVQPGAGVHRGGDPDHPLVAPALRRPARSPNTCVYCGGAGLPPDGLRAATAGHAVGDRLRLGGVPLLHALEPALLGGREALALDRRAVDHDRPLGDQRLAQRAAHRAHVVAVDHADVGEVELLPPQPGRPERLDRLLDVRAEPLERGADPGRAAWSGPPRSPRGRATASGSGGRG